MIGAGLLLRTFAGLVRDNPGFDAAGVATAGIWLPVPNDPSADVYAKPAVRAAFIRQVIARVGALPGAGQVGVTSLLPLTSAPNRAALVVDGATAPPPADLTAEVTAISPRYFDVMRARLSSGRFFDEHDDGTGRLVAVVDETTARRFWPGATPLDKRVRFGSAPSQPWFTVVGVVGDIKQDGLDRDAVPHVYASIYQRPSRALNIVVRTDRPAGSLERGIREAVQAVDPDLPVFAVRGMTEVVEASLAPRRFSAAVVGAFAVLALLLASIGIYGLLAYTVGQRTAEIGLRMALGAQRKDVRTAVLASGLKVSAMGTAAGIALAAAAAPALGSVLYGVQPRDPLVFIAVPVLLLAAATAASAIPAWRATNVDLLVALRR